MVSWDANFKAGREPRAGQASNEKVLLSAPVLVYGCDANNNPFLDEAPIHSLNAQGGVLALSANVRRGQTILFMNAGAQQDRKARVLYVGPDCSGRKKTAFEFLRP